MKLFNYSKEGPGVDKNAPRKKGFALFFEVFKNHLWEMCKVNMMYIIASIPMIAVFAFIGVPCIMKMLDAYTINSGLSYDAVVSQYAVGLCLMTVFLMLIFYGSGPASASVAYIYRNYTRSEHIWLWQDFKAKFKENLKQGIIVGIINAIILFILIYGVNFYYSTFLQSNNRLYYIFMIAIIIVFAIFTFMNFYIYQVMVTFEVTVGQLYKNALILSLSALPQNLIIATIDAVLCYLIYTSFQSGFSMVITVFATVGVLRFPIEFCATENIRKLVLDNMQKDEKAGREG